MLVLHGLHAFIYGLFDRCTFLALYVDVNQKLIKIKVVSSGYGRDKELLFKIEPLI